jgi:hypothetical protein
MKMTVLPAEEALGLPLAHDLTRIDAAAGTKGAAFKRGQIVRAEDLPVLRSMGRTHLSLLELEPGEVHEDDAARSLAAVLAGEGLEVRGPDEGRCTLFALRDGLLRYDADRVHRINEDPDWVLALLPPNSPVRRGEAVAGFRVRPLVAREEQVSRAVGAALPLAVLPWHPLRVGLVTTGREIKEGLIRDAFLPKFERKLAEYGGTLLGQSFASDEREEIAGALAAWIDAGADLVVATGGMSVDPDDRTGGAIRSLSDRVSFEGVPALPGAMLMLAWRGPVALVGAPACVVHDERTSLDRLLPLLFAGIDPAREVRRWGVGGLCAHCPVCRFPRCAFAAG